MVRYNEYEGLSGNEFQPFDDSGDKRLSQLIAISTQSGSGYVTAKFDTYRQGVEITSPQQLYKGNQPKLWSGNLSHHIKIVTYGQARSWTEYKNNKKFDDIVMPFNVLQWIESPETYPMPIYLNDGPQSEEEAIVEPFTIPFRKSPQEGARPPRTPKGTLEDGNGFDSPIGATNRVLQFIEYAKPLTARYFLDAGEQYFGNGILGNGIKIEGYVPFIERQGTPFNDTQDEEIVKQVNVGTGSLPDQQFNSELKLLKIELDEDIRQNYFQKSANAGIIGVYGPNQARYGTDSITFSGIIRGS
jgi:hypothetical protein